MISPVRPTHVLDDYGRLRPAFELTSQNLSVPTPQVLNDGYTLYGGGVYATKHDSFHRRIQLPGHVSELARRRLFISSWASALPS